ncbi:MAG: gamma-glutamylcyclotransferase [Bdellovibrionales bacterium]|nr:gamma-glutamylcyclotransferase [Bdellovibrionales bacterium]
MQSTLSLFVYGSLYEGMVHYDKIEQYIVEKTPARAIGQAYRLPSGFPVFLSPCEAFGNDIDKVHGVLVQIEAPDLILQLLNEFHGVSHMAPDKSLFFKELIKVQTDSDEIREAYVYAMNRAKLPKNSLRIPNGDWIADLQREPTIPQILSEKQANYIKKLSNSTGREIVPIDLELYRELMKLELIVDKGRRLALSKLGKEVARYLPE